MRILVFASATVLLSGCTAVSPSINSLSPQAFNSPTILEGSSIVAAMNSASVQRFEVEGGPCKSSRVKAGEVSRCEFQSSGKIKIYFYGSARRSFDMQQGQVFVVTPTLTYISAPQGE